MNKNSIMQYTSFYLLYDPRTGEDKFVITSNKNSQIMLQELKQRATRDAKDESDLMVWVKDIISIGRSPRVRDYGQFKFNSHEIEEKKKGLEISLGLREEDKTEEVKPKPKAKRTRKPKKTEPKKDDNGDSRSIG